MKKFAIIRNYGKCERTNKKEIIYCTVIRQEIIGETDEEIYIPRDTHYNFEEGFWWDEELMERKWARAYIKSGRIEDNRNK